MKTTNYNKMLLYTFSVHDKKDEDRKDRSYYSLKAPDEKTAKEKLIEITNDEIDDILFLNVSIPFEVPGFNYPSQSLPEIETVMGYSESDVLVILQNFGKDHNQTNGLVIKKWFEQWVEEHPLTSQCLPELTSEQKQEMAKAFQPDTETSFKQGMYSGYIFGLEAYEALIKARSELRKRIK